MTPFPNPWVGRPDRDRYISHEESVNQILDDFVAACDPLEAKA